jgi:hypothetical protein
LSAAPTTYTYDASGSLQSLTDPQGRTTSFGYVPEPGTLFLVASGLLLVAWRERRRSARAKRA